MTKVEGRKKQLVVSHLTVFVLLAWLFVQSTAVHAAVTTPGSSDADRVRATVLENRVQLSTIEKRIRELDSVESTESGQRMTLRRQLNELEATMALPGNQHIAELRTRKERYEQQLAQLVKNYEQNREERLRLDQKQSIVRQTISRLEAAAVELEERQHARNQREIELTGVSTKDDSPVTKTDGVAAPVADGTAETGVPTADQGTTAATEARLAAALARLEKLEALLAQVLARSVSRDSSESTDGRGPISVPAVEQANRPSSGGRTVKLRDGQGRVVETRFTFTDGDGVERTVLTKADCEYQFLGGYTVRRYLHYGRCVGTIHEDTNYGPSQSSRSTNRCYRRRQVPSCSNQANRRAR